MTKGASDDDDGDDVWGLCSGVMFVVRLRLLFVIGLCLRVSSAVLSAALCVAVVSSVLSPVLSSVLSSLLYPVYFRFCLRLCLRFCLGVVFGFIFGVCLRCCPRFCHRFLYYLPLWSKLLCPAVRVCLFGVASINLCVI